MGSVLSCLQSYTKPSALPEGKLCLTPNGSLAKELRGRKIHVDMTDSFINWPMGARHAAYETLRLETDRLLEIAFPDPQQCKKFKRCDFASFSCLWWPTADWENLYTAMVFTVCLFAWDDTIDTNENSLASDFEKAALWRQQSLAYFKYHLKLSPQEKDEPHCPDNICILFKEFGQRFCESFGEVQRRRMFSKIKDFVEHNEVEQAERLANRVPNYEEYLDIRYGVTGVRMFSLLLEVANQSTLPSWIMDSFEMDEIIKECNFIIIIINDILSLKKEIATDCVVNIVPVLYNTGMPFKHIISFLIEKMIKSRDRLDSMADKLDMVTKADPQLNTNVMKFIDGIRIMDTGTLIYSIESPRYGVVKYVQADGSLDIVL
ncbi:unnamed protein product [Discula destructiva]